MKQHKSITLAVLILLEIALTLCLSSCRKSSENPADGATVAANGSATAAIAGPTTAEPAKTPTTAEPTTAPTTTPTTSTHTVHTFGEWTVQTPATCRVEGVSVRRCSQCDFKESRPLAQKAHDLDALNICKKCYYVEFDEDAPLVELGVICNSWYGNGNKANYPWDIKVWNGKVYRAAGDYDKNSGATTILAYDIATHTWDASCKVSDEAIHGFVELNGTLCTPGIDPREGWAYGNYYSLDQQGMWQKIRNLPNGVHNFDMIECSGKIFAGLGTETVGNTVAMSTDGGKTFGFVPLYKDGKRYDLSAYDYSRTYEFVKLKDTVYALVALYRSSGSATWGIFRYEDGKMHYTAEGRTLLDGSEFTRKYFGGDFEFNGTCYLTARRLYAIRDFSDPSGWQTIRMPNAGKVSDAILRDGVIYVLSSRQNADKSYHTIIYRSTTGLPGSFEEFASYDYSGFPLSFDYDGTHFYVGTSSNTLDQSKIGMVLRVKPAA